MSATSVQAAPKPAQKAVSKAPSASKDLAHQDTPALLRRWQAIASLACVFFAVLTCTGLLLTWQANTRAAADADQVSRVQDVQSDLFRADALATNAFLVGGLESPAHRQSYDEAIASVTEGIAAAAAEQPADRDALAALNLRVLNYAQSIQEARANNRQGFPVGAQYLKQASSDLRSAALPIAAALVQANQDRATSEILGAWTLAFLAAGVLTLAVLWWVNRRLAAMFKRRFNLGLLWAAMAVLGLTIAATALGFTDSSARSTLYQESFLPGVAAAQARTSGNDARSNEALRLIARGSGAAYEESWITASQLTTGGLGAAGLDGLNSSWAKYATAHQEIVKLDQSGAWEKAVAAATDEDQAASTSFETFDKAAQNRAASSLSDVSAGVVEANIAFLTLAAIAVGVGLATTGLIAWGIGLRRKEFA